MSDIFQEIEEDLQREKWDKIWKDYGTWIMMGLGAFVIGVAGFLWSGEASERRNAALSDEYLSASALLESGDSDAGLAALEDIIANKTGGYVILASMQKAAKLVSDGKVDEAVRAYDAIRSSNKTEDVLGQLAAIKAGWLLVESEDYDAMNARLGDIAFAEEEGPWAAGATEILAYSAVRADKLEEAEGLYRKIRTMQSASLGIVGRSAEMLSIIEPEIVRSVPVAVPAQEADAENEIAIDATEETRDEPADDQPGDEQTTIAPEGE